MRRMELLFDRMIAAPPEVVWPLLTDPARMSEWSEAPIGSLSLGAGGRPDAAGATRSVNARAFGLSMMIEEAILEADRPRRFVYRVMRGAGIRDHEGVITLRPEAGGTRLVWRVRLRGVVWGWDKIVGALVRRGLGRSLDAMAKLAVAESRAA